MKFMADVCVICRMQMTSRGPVQLSQLGKHMLLQCHLYCLSVLLLADTLHL